MQRFLFNVDIEGPNGLVQIASGLFKKRAITCVYDLMRGFDKQTHGNGVLKPRKYIKRHMPQYHGNDVRFDVAHETAIVVTAMMNTAYMATPEWYFQTRTWEEGVFSTSVDYNRKVLQEFADKIKLEYRGQRGKARRNRKMIQDAAVFFAQEEKRNRK